MLTFNVRSNAGYLFISTNIVLNIWKHFSVHPLKVTIDGNLHDLDRSHLIECFDKPFTKIKWFGTNEDKFTPEKGCLNKLFPNLKQLAIVLNPNTSFFDVNSNHFKYLEEFY